MTTPPLILTPAELDAIKRHAVEDYPSECCGAIVVRGEERRLLRLRNVQDEKHREDPDRFPRDSRTAYYVHGDDALMLERLPDEGFSIAAVYHSHIDVDAYFSATDKRQALLGQDPKKCDPMFVEAVWLVVSVVSGRVQAIGSFRWHPIERDFLPVDLEMLVPGGKGSAG